MYWYPSLPSAGHAPPVQGSKRGASVSRMLPAMLTEYACGCSVRSTAIMVAGMRSPPRSRYQTLSPLANAAACDATFAAACDVLDSMSSFRSPFATSTMFWSPTRTLPGACSDACAWACVPIWMACTLLRKCGLAGASTDAGLTAASDLCAATGTMLYAPTPSRFCALAFSASESLPLDSASAAVVSLCRCSAIASLQAPPPKPLHQPIITCFGIYSI